MSNTDAFKQSFNVDIKGGKLFFEYNQAQEVFNSESE